jgi:hypothetical protein
MQAANEGAQDAQAGERVQSIGIRVDLPFEQDVGIIREHQARWLTAQSQRA